MKPSATELMDVMRRIRTATEVVQLDVIRCELALIAADGIDVRLLELRVDRRERDLLGSREAVTRGRGILVRPVPPSPRRQAPDRLLRMSRYSRALTPVGPK